MCKNSQSCTVVIVTGPVGAGKSTVMTKLSQTIPNSVAIDGDILGIGAENVTILKGERNDYSIWQIYRALMEGKTPIISAGGGIFFSYKKGEFTLRDNIQTVLGVNVKIIVCVPDMSATDIAPKPTTYDIGTVYSDSDTVKRTVRERVAQKRWTVPRKDTGAQNKNKQKPEDDTAALEGFCELIAQKSKQNLQFGKGLMEIADECFVYPVIKSETYDKQSAALNVQPIIDRVVCDSTPKSAKFAQVRVLVKVCYIDDDTEPQFGHITWIYDENRSQEWNLLTVSSIATIGKHAGHVYSVPQKDNPKKCVCLAAPDTPIHPDKRTHITLSPGEHEPKYMIDVTLAIVGNKNEFTLPSKKGPIVYDLSKAKKQPCQLHYMDIFGI
jgi:hypothetical protein